MRRRQDMRNSRRHHQRIEREVIGPQVAQRDVGGVDAGCHVVVPRHDVRAHRRERTRGGQAVAAQPQHGEAFSREQIVGERAHRIFNVARPTSARIIEMIQKRMTMVGSAQPFFSK